MKKVLMIIILCLLLTGCWTYDLNGFVVPDDIQFLECIAGLDTVPKIAQYMTDNFTYKSIISPMSPYEVWQTKKCDCDGYAVFGVFVARQHGIEAYQVKVWYTNEDKHMNAVYKIGDYWMLTNCHLLFGMFSSIEEAIIWDANYMERELIKYKILNGVGKE